MSKLFFTIFSIIGIGLFSLSMALGVQAQADPGNVAGPKACVMLTGNQRSLCLSCIQSQKGAWIKVPIPVIVPANIPSPPGYLAGGGKNTTESLDIITANGHCIHNIAVLGYLLYYFTLVLMAVVSLFILMLGGYQYLTALGSAQRTGDAKARIFAALAGLVLGLTSYLILQFINPDLVSSRYDEKLIKENLKKAMENLMNRDTLAQGICPKDTGEQQCREKKIGDLCTPSIAGQASLPGYCEEDANIVGCVCNQNDCAYFCAEGSTTITDPKTCVGKQCYAGGIQGVCLTKTATPDKVECLDAKGMCENGTCGSGAPSNDLDCRGFYQCTGGYCLGEAGGAKTGAALCKSNAEICRGGPHESSCGSSYIGKPYAQDVMNICKGKQQCDPATSTGEGACLAGGLCFPYLGDSVGCPSAGWACDLRVSNLNSGDIIYGACQRYQSTSNFYCIPVQ